MKVELLLRRLAKMLPFSWLAVVLALFLLWLVSSTALRTQDVVTYRSSDS